MATGAQGIAGSRCRLWVLFSLALVLCTVATNRSHAESPIPNLIGTWEAVDGGMHFWHGRGLQVGDNHQLSIEIDEQSGPYFSGKMTYRNPPDVQGHDGSGLVVESSEEFVGVIHWDGQTITFADTPDTGLWHATLVDENTLAATTVESGEHAVAGRFLLKRQQ